MKKKPKIKKQDKKRKFNKEESDKLMEGLKKAMVKYKNALKEMGDQ